MIEIKRNQIYRTSLHGNSGRIFTVRVLNVDTNTDMQTVATITYAYTHRPWEHITLEYFDFLDRWQLEYDVGHIDTYPSESPAQKASGRDHWRDVNRFRHQMFAFNKIDFSAQPIWDVIEDMRHKLTEVRSMAHEIKFAGLDMERVESCIGGLTMTIAYLYHAAQELKQAHANDPEGNPR